MKKMLSVLLYASMSKQNRIMLFGEFPFLCVFHWIVGYRTCQHMEGYNDGVDFLEFNEFIFKELKEPMGSLSPYTVIAQRTENDEEAYDLFFSIIKKYCQIKGIKAHKF